MSGMIDRMFRLDGEVALVTGSSRGLGAAMATALAEAGADVVLHDRCCAGDTEKAIRERTGGRWRLESLPTGPSATRPR